ncbi:hypothetical protein F5Y12DRAFT_710579 [Xylaria sp. FL1777]|nr:hypothetical protein F5Y12DRAFT_710579 [Xylaria sp. FL1777]
MWQPISFASSHVVESGQTIVGSSAAFGGVSGEILADSREPWRAVHGLALDKEDTSAGILRRYPNMRTPCAARFELLSMSFEREHVRRIEFFMAQCTSSHETHGMTRVGWVTRLGANRDGGNRGIGILEGAWLVVQDAGVNIMTPTLRPDSKAKNINSRR